MMRCQSPYSTEGYTLIEMLVVLTLMGLIMASAPTLISAARPGAQARAAAYDIANALRQARNDALTKGKSEIVRLDRGTKSYVDSVARVHRMPAGVSVEAVTNTAQHDGLVEFQFFPDGSSTGGLIRVRAGAQEHRVVAHPITGRISFDE